MDTNLEHFQQYGAIFNNWMLAVKKKKKGLSVIYTMNKCAGIHKVIRDHMGTGLGLIQECENTEF